MTSRFERLRPSALLLLALALTAGTLSAQDAFLSLNTGEFRDFRRVLFHVSAADDPGLSADILQPQLSQEPEYGRFTVTVNAARPLQYLGADQFRETGRMPLRVKVTPDNDGSYRFEFETLSFEKVLAWYLPGQGSYIFDIYRSLPPESFLLEESIGLNTLLPEPLDLPASAADARSRGSSRLPSFLSALSPAHRQLIMKALLFALLIVLVLMMFFALMQAYTGSLLRDQKKQQRRSAARTGKTKDRPKDGRGEDPPSPDAEAAALQALYAAVERSRHLADNLESSRLVRESDLDLPVLRTPEDRDRAIRELMARRNISYDEAAMILMMKPGNLNVKV